MTFLRFIHRREWLLLALSVITIFSQVYFELVVPEYMQSITTTISSPHSSVGAVVADGWKMLAAALAAMACAIITGYCLAVFGTTVARRLRAGVYNKAFDLSSAEVNNLGTDSLITRSTNDVTQIQTFLVMGLQITIKAPVMALWAGSKIARESLTWTIPTAIAVVITVVALGIAMGITIPRMVKMQKITDNLNRVTREHLTGLRVIRAYSTQKFHQQRFETVNTELRNTSLFINTGMAFIMPILSTIMTGLSLAIYVLGAVLINGTADVASRITLFGQMIIFSTYAIQVVSSFMMMSFVFIIGPRALISWRRIREVLHLVPSIHDGEVQHSDLRGTVEFRNVDFCYPEAEGDALHDISFTAKPGQTVAIIGSTGSGKSSLINLIPRFYDVRLGAVLVDGVDVREWNQTSLRERISYVPQKNTLFSGTVASNIAFGEGHQKISTHDVLESAQTAVVTDFIASKEDGFASAVTQGGSNFSGGQKQRLSLARAFARDGEIMIFDDSFSALDFRTERDIRTQLQQNLAHKTIIVVAQRIGTVRDADTIIVLDKGRIAGIGTHAELMANNTVYQDIALSQLSEEELAS